MSMHMQRVGVGEREFTCFTNGCGEGSKSYEVSDFNTNIWGEQLSVEKQHNFEIICQPWVGACSNCPYLTCTRLITVFEPLR